jgi:hypothetical protein
MAVIDQLRNFDGTSNTYGGKIAFSEPITAKWNLIVDYSHNRNDASSYRNTYRKSNNGKYESLDPLFSNNFDLQAQSNGSSATIRMVDTKLKMAFGTGVSSIKLKLMDVNTMVRNQYDFLNLTPQAQLAYTFKPQTTLSVTYRGTTRQPGIDQLQPLRNNEDPLHEFIGNPDLKVGFNHDISMFFNQYKVLSSRGIFANMHYQIMNNDISNLTIIDTVRGKQVYTPVNVNGNTSWNFWTSWNRWRGQKKFNYSININGNGGSRNNFVQQKDAVVKNLTTHSTINLGLSLGYHEEEKKNFDFRPKIGYTTTKSSIQRNFNNNFFSYGGELSGFIMLPYKLELSSYVNADLRQKLPNFPANMNIITWNASIAKKVMKKKEGKIILEANDILNQNKGINRIVNSNFVQEDRFQRISRYFLLRFEWTFNKMPGETK